MTEHQNIHNNSEGYVCGECGADVSLEDKVCPKCGADISEIEENKEELAEEMTSRRYPALIIIAGVYQVLAWLVAILAVIGIFVGLNSESSFGIPLLVGLVIGGAIGFVTLLAASESIKVFIDIEENTRKTTELQSKKTLEGKQSDLT